MKNKVSSFADEGKLEVLRCVERLANPTSVKLITSQLLHLKQHQPEAFRDVCVYSEVCSQFAENIYRLGTRRILHELFLDVSFDCLRDQAEKILGDENNSRRRERLKSPSDTSEHKSLSGGDLLPSPTDSVKTLDSLRLTFNENKFPIRQKK